MLLQNAHLSTFYQIRFLKKLSQTIRGENCKCINDVVGRGNLNLSSLHTPRQVIVKTLISTHARPIKSEDGTSNPFNPPIAIRNNEPSFFLLGDYEIS